jgi:hypothetical protein
MIAEPTDFDNGEMKKGQRMLALTLDIPCQFYVKPQEWLCCVPREVRNEFTKMNLSIGEHYVKP